MSLRRRTVRLRRTFGALVLAAGPFAAMQACSDPAIILEQPPPGNDATTVDVAVAEAAAADGPAHDGSSPPLDATCQLVAEQLDAGPDVDPRCRYTLPCGLAPDTAFVIRGCGFYLVSVEDGGDASLGCSVPAANGCTNDVYTPPSNGSLTFECIDCLGGSGRRPNGLVRAARSSLRDEGDYFARMAHDEAASIYAFARMHGELVDRAAPPSLVRAAQRAITDEQRHARVMSRRARALGAPVTTPRVRRQPRHRSLESIARENAIEGCVRETYGALVLCWQASHAAEPSLRPLFARIAADETRHAALSWELAAWSEEQLDARARARVASARRRAFRELKDAVSMRPVSAIDGVTGQPPRAVALALLEGLATRFGIA